VGTQKRQRNRPRTLGLDMLEARELLSAISAGAQPAAEVSAHTRTPRQVYGSLEGQGVDLGNSRHGTNVFTAAGPEAPVGVGTFTGHDRYRAVIENRAITGYNVSDGIGTLTDSSGEKLDIAYSGNIYESGTTYAFTYTGTVDGGTGEFKKAAGSLDAYGTYSIATGQFTVLSYTLTLYRA
jgi:hypothetical protein